MPSISQRRESHYSFALQSKKSPTLLKAGIIAINLILSLAAVGCFSQPEVREIEVTREVPVTQQVPVTVAIPQTVEVTRVTEILQTVEVIREMPVTRVVMATLVPTPVVAATLVPAPIEPPTAVPDIPTPSPTTTVQSTPTTTPVLDLSSRFAGWSMQTEYHGDRELAKFYQSAVAHGTLPTSPILTYQCDTGGNTALYIDWGAPIFTVGRDIRYKYPDPFENYHDDYLEALFEYTDGLVDFIKDLRLDQREQTDLDDLWEQVWKRWLRSDDTLSNPDNLTEYARQLTYGQALIELGFYLEPANSDQRGPYGPPVEIIESLWLVDHNDSRIIAGALGEIRLTYRNVHSPVLTGTQMMMTATVMEPEQPTEMVATWNAEDMLNIMGYCKSIVR